MKDAGSSDDAIHYAQNYSLGIIIESADRKGKLVEGHSNNTDRLRVRHIGNFSGNDSSMSATMPCSLDHFRLRDSANMRGIIPETNSFITQNDVVAKHFLLTMPGHDYAKRMDDYFLSKSREDSEFVIPDKTDGKCWRRYWQHLDLSQGRDKNIQAWQKELIDEGRLPKNFAEYHDEIIEAYRPTQEALRQHLIANYLDENGVLDREKIARDFSKAEDFAKLREEVLAPHLAEAQEKVENIFARSEAQLAAQKATKSWVERVATKGSSEITR